jgi:hypothetical protein
MSSTIREKSALVKTGPVVLVRRDLSRPATYDYASEVVNEKSVACANGTLTSFAFAFAFAFTLSRVPIIPGSVSIVAVVSGNTAVVGDDGSGKLVGASLNPAGP